MRLLEHGTPDGNVFFINSKFQNIMINTKTNSETVTMCITVAQQNLLELLSSNQETSYADALEYVIDEALLSDVDLFSEDKEKYLRIIELKRIIRKL